ncbi:MAG: DUF4286 family protein [Rikenellaceae bacterium]|nr:DUF4286 family protein [Rikenellaceae bacterium]
MYILNTSFMVEYDVHDLWLDMIRNRVVPYIRSKGFPDLTFTKVISNDNGGHHTYSLQVEMDDLAHYSLFMDDILAEYASICAPVFGEKALYFTSLLKKVEL